MRLAVALGMAIVFGAVGDILFSVGMKSNGEVKFLRPRDIPAFVKLVVTNGYVLLGVVAMAIYFASYIAALAWVDVSVANPLTALSYLIATVYAVAALRERIGVSRGAGVVCIVLGSILVGISS